MTLADMIPTMDDASLANLQANAERLRDGSEGPRRQQALELIPLIDAELSRRLAAKPPKATRRVKSKTAAPPTAA